MSWQFSLRDMLWLMAVSMLAVGYVGSRIEVHDAEWKLSECRHSEKFFREMYTDLQIRTVTRR